MFVYTLDLLFIWVLEAMWNVLNYYYNYVIGLFLFISNKENKIILVNEW